MRRRRRSVGAIALAGVAALALTLGVAAPAWAEPDFPTWEEVEEAKKNESAKRAEIAKIEALLDELETSAADHARTVLERAEEYQLAQEALAQATTRAEQYENRADAALEKAVASRERAARFVAQLARSSAQDNTLAIILSGGGENLLAGLGAMGKLSERSAEAFERAEFDQNAARSLLAQAEAAQQQRTTLASAAEDALEKAKAAAREAEARAAEHKRASVQLYAQLALLKGVSADTERRYQEGVAWEKKQEADKTPPPPAPPVNPPPPEPSTSAVSKAISFAKAQLGEPYQFGGMGPGSWDCSGLTKASYASAGVYIGTHSASNQFNTMQAAGRLVPLAQMVAGDLLWYSNGGSVSGSKYHTTMYIGDGKMIEAPRPGTVVRIVSVRYGDLVPYAGRPTP